MKKIVSLIAVVALVFAMTSCKSNMRRDVKRLTHKTEKCLAKVDVNDQSTVENEEFTQCYAELEELMNLYNEKYKDPEQSVKFGKMYLEELQKTDLPDELKEFFKFLYSLGSDSQDFILEPDNQIDTTNMMPDTVVMKDVA